MKERKSVEKAIDFGWKSQGSYFSTALLQSANTFKKMFFNVGPRMNHLKTVQNALFGDVSFLPKIHSELSSKRVKKSDFKRNFFLNESISTDFRLFSFFSQCDNKYSIISNYINGKSVNVMYGIRTLGLRMVGESIFTRSF